jgi:hypothetical protein
MLLPVGALLDADVIEMLGLLIWPDAEPRLGAIGVVCAPVVAAPKVPTGAF